MEDQTYLSINKWAEEDRPREKLLLKGKASLSDAELIGILIGSGTRTLSAVDVAKQILHSANNDLHKLAKLTVKDLTKIKGIGEAKAITIVSALELGRRRKELEPTKAFKITSSQDAYSLLSAELTDLPHEEFWIILLKRNNEVIGKHQISRGGISGTVADPKIIFQRAIENGASGIILAHNHPSGNTQPSEADKSLTKKVKSAGNVLDIAVLDHIIFTDHKYYSFADESMMP
ncbi:MAG: DNA repair protein RadC [Marinoscillum sp.]|jgi:DNA repair protein RadC